MKQDNKHQTRRCACIFAATLIGLVPVVSNAHELREKVAQNSAGQQRAFDREARQSSGDLKAARQIAPERLELTRTHQASQSAQWLEGNRIGTGRVHVVIPSAGAR